jgi:hypothetical protein
MIKTQYNWKPVVRDFFKMAEQAGFEVTHIDDGEGYEDIRLRAKTQADRRAVGVEMVCSVDEARVNFLHVPTDKRIAAFIVLGNGPEEICADYTSGNEDADRAFDKVNNDFYSKWEMRKTPTIEVV